MAVLSRRESAAGASCENFLRRIPAWRSFSSIFSEPAFLLGSKQPLRAFSPLSWRTKCDQGINCKSLVHIDTGWGSSWALGRAVEGRRNGPNIWLSAAPFFANPHFPLTLYLSQLRDFSSTHIHPNLQSLLLPRSFPGSAI